jgi:uncharacterized protein (TIGR03083 family)
MCALVSGDDPMFAEGLRRLGSGVPFLQQEARRLDSYLRRLGDEDWVAPTRSEGWKVRDIVAHLASGEEYNEACFDDALAEVDVFADDETYNTEHVMRRRTLSRRQIFAEWQRRRERAHALFAAADPAKFLGTSAGPYPVGLQAWHIGMHYATHNDDIGVTVPTTEVLARTLARAEFCAYAIEEKGLPHQIEIAAGTARISTREGTAVLPLAEFVDLVAGYGEVPSAALAPIRGLV